MIRAKRAYLRDAEIAYAKLDEMHRTQLKRGEIVAETIQAQTALGQLIGEAEQMTVWPFDRATFYRSAAILFGPIVPSVVTQLPKLLVVIKTYLHLTP